jgi:hypothetical protein
MQAIISLAQNEYLQDWRFCIAASGSAAAVTACALAILTGALFIAAICACAAAACAFAAVQLHDVGSIKKVTDTLKNHNGNLLTQLIAYQNALKESVAAWQAIGNLRPEFAAANQRHQELIGGTERFINSLTEWSKGQYEELKRFLNVDGMAKTVERLVTTEARLQGSIATLENLKDVLQTHVTELTAQNHVYSALNQQLTTLLPQNLGDVTISVHGTD